MGDDSTLLLAKADGVFVYIGTYGSKQVAEDDYAVVKDLHLAGAGGTYDAAVVTKDATGTVHENKDETTTRHGAWGSRAVGALIGCLFPPALVCDRSPMDEYRPRCHSGGVDRYRRGRG